MGETTYSGSAGAVAPGIVTARMQGLAFDDFAGVTPTNPVVRDVTTRPPAAFSSLIALLSVPVFQVWSTIMLHGSQFGLVFGCVGMQRGIVGHEFSEIIVSANIAYAIARLIPVDVTACTTLTGVRQLCLGSLYRLTVLGFARG